MVLQMLTLGVCICYAYAVIGLEAFGTTVVGPRPYCNEKSAAPSPPPQPLHAEAPMLARPHHRHVAEELCIDHIENFETPGHALLALFQIMTGNNWNEVMYPNSLGSNITGSSMYFISFYFIAVLLLINLMTSLILDIYISRNDLLDQRGENVSTLRYPGEDGSEVVWTLLKVGDWKRQLVETKAQLEQQSQALEQSLASLEEEVAKHEMKHLQEVLRSASANSEGAWSDDVIEKLCSLAHHDWQQVSNVLAQQSKRSLTRPRAQSPSLSQSIADSPGVGFASDNGSSEGLERNGSSASCDPSNSQRSNGGRGKALLAVGHAADVASDPLQKCSASYEPPNLLLDYLEAPSSLREPLSPREMLSMEEGYHMHSSSQPSSGLYGRMQVETDPDRRFIVDLEVGDIQVSVSQPTTLHEKLKADPDQHLLTMEAGADSVDNVCYSSSQPSTPGTTLRWGNHCRHHSAAQAEGYGVVDPPGPAPEPPAALELFEAAEAGDADRVPHCAREEPAEEGAAVECGAALKPKSSIHARSSDSTPCESSSPAPQPSATSSSFLSSSSAAASQPFANPQTSSSAAEVCAAVKGGAEAIRAQAQPQSAGSEPLEGGLVPEGSRSRGMTFPTTGSRTPPAKRSSELSAEAGLDVSLREAPQRSPYSISALKLNFEKVMREPPLAGQKLQYVTRQTECNADEEVSGGLPALHAQSPASDASAQARSQPLCGGRGELTTTEGCAEAMHAQQSIEELKQCFTAQMQLYFDDGIRLSKCQ